MRALLSLFLGFALFALSALGNDQVPKQKFDYQSDVARLRKIVINSLYSHRDVFLRELISNANDALEKLRLTSLTDKQVLDGADQLNITIKAFKDEDGTGRIVIADTGIGMTKEELTSNLGTLAKSGTSEFLAKAESTDATGQGNLIGAFGLGFYSSFLVADRVYVASRAAKSTKNPEPQQYVFSSSADESSFEVYPDPRGNTLGRGTEITLVLKPDALEYLETEKIVELVQKHSSFSTTFPIYLLTQKSVEVPDEDAEAEVPKPEETATPETEDEDEAVVEEEKEDEEKEPPKPKTKTITVEEWVQLNSQAPIWTRDPKTVTDEEYESFYQATFKDSEKPLAWYHFSGDAGSGTSFKAIIYVPSHLDEAFWQSGPQTDVKDVRLMVKRVFITNDLGENPLPKWASWVKAVIDADDLPLNVSREMLQSNKFLKQLKSIITKRLAQLLSRIAEEEPEKYQEILKVYNNVFKLGAVEDHKNRDKLASLVRFATNQRNNTSLDEYLENKKQGQRQIFYLADVGKTPESLAKSVFIEKLHARGYEVLLLNEALDEIFVQNLREWKKIRFQDVAKAGLKFGDEDPAQEKAELEEQTERYKPLLDWLKKEAAGVVRDVIISNRLVTSSCAIVADAMGYTANVEKLMSSSNLKKNDFMHEFAKKQKILEINPRSPLIEGLLRRVQQLPAEDEERDLDAEDELREVTTVLIDGALVRSGFEVPDSNEFFTRVDRILRRSLGVSETAPTDTRVKPAPPVDPSLPIHIDMEELRRQEAEAAIAAAAEKDGDSDDGVRIDLPDHLKDQVRWEVEEIDEEGNVVGDTHTSHDEL
ncbi:cation-transporting ATPase [Panus rudis PR-1116 ss-1]|nr:cation-transporting ATPase [Panus rudis PR-1116 ss-1]